MLLFGLTLIININGQALDSLIQKDYSEYAKRAKENGFVVMSKEDWFKQMGNQYKPKVMFANAPGMHLIKAKNEILAGFTLQLLATAGTLINTAANFDGPNYKAINTAMGGLSLVGLILEISGVVNIGKAGVSLNENGVGIKIKF